MPKRRAGVRLGAPHPWMKHGGFVVLHAVAKGELDGRTAPAQAIKAVCLQLAADLGSDWERLEVAKRLLVEQVAVKATVLGMMTAYALASEVVAPDGRLRPPLSSHFLSWSNSIRLDLLALGLERRQKQVMDLTGYLVQTYGAKGETSLVQETAPARSGEQGGAS